MTNELSTAARTVLGSVFGWNAIVTYHNIESVPSPEMQEAIDELLAAGLIDRTTTDIDLPAHGKAVRYRVANGVDLDPYRREASQRFLDGTAPSIRVFVKRADASAA